MDQPFIRNHQYNFIKKQVAALQHAYNTVSDRKVVEAVKLEVQSKIVEMFPEASDSQQRMLEGIAALQTSSDFQQYTAALEPYMEAFAPVTENELKKLFPKAKKLKLPGLDAIDFRYITYLGWNDIATNNMYIVYRLDGRLIGIEGRCTRLNKKSVCSLCNRHEEVALFSAVSKSRPANASPDYYKAFGNYVCVHSEACNNNITDVAPLEDFLRRIVG
ncbi:FusB/FusC family EF-G-binding protein [Paenibacillus chartarius]|uniref:FusB/FusC family EF-G-binding protein n=1 Tax=Paenibacillus chartarius TaxID=747481 RepID=A0ABV6DS44_9BACL